MEAEGVNAQFIGSQRASWERGKCAGSARFCAHEAQSWGFWRLLKERGFPGRAVVFGSSGHPGHQATESIKKRKTISKLKQKRSALTNTNSWRTVKITCFRKLSDECEILGGHHGRLVEGLSEVVLYRGLWWSNKGFLHRLEKGGGAEAQPGFWSSQEQEHGFYPSVLLPDGAVFCFFLVSSIFGSCDDSEGVKVLPTHPLLLYQYLKLSINRGGVSKMSQWHVCLGGTRRHLAPPMLALSKLLCDGVSGASSFVNYKCL